MGRMRVAIIGAGIAGLSLAHELIRRGHDEVVILERARVFTHAGGGIHLGPWGMAVLEGNGLADDLRARGVTFGTRAYFDAAGALLGRVDFQDIARRHGAPLGIYAHRADLHAVLAAAIPDGIVVQGVQITAIHEDVGGVLIETHGHGSFEADLLVGCDGLHSQVRHHMLGIGEQPLSKRAFRTVIAAPDDLVDPEIYRGVGSTIGLGRIDRHGSMYVWIHTPSVVGAEVEHDPRTAVLDLLATYDAPRARDLEAGIANAGDVVSTELFEVIVPTMWRARSVLAGDAAHAMSPSAGLGGTMAFEDAAVLARLLSKAVAGDVTVPEALDRYARQRLPRVEAVRAQARYTDYDGQLASTDLCRIRDERFARLLSKPDAFASEVTGILDLER